MYVYHCKSLHSIPYHTMKICLLFGLGLAIFLIVKLILTNITFNYTSTITYWPIRGLCISSYTCLFDPQRALLLPVAFTPSNPVTHPITWKTCKSSPGSLHQVNQTCEPSKCPLYATEALLLFHMHLLSQIVGWQVMLLEGGMFVKSKRCSHSCVQHIGTKKSSTRQGGLGLD